MDQFVILTQIQLFSPQAKLQWKRCADMPIKANRMQVVAIGEKVYTGCGDTENIEDTIAVLMYDLVKDDWGHLPNHCVGLFALCQFQGNLITVGGLPVTNKVYRYNEESQEWEEFQTQMPTARYCLSVLTTATAIIACGGVIDTVNYKPVPTAIVEVYSSETSQWYTADPDPLPYACCLMTSVTIGSLRTLHGRHLVYICKLYYMYKTIPTHVQLHASIKSFLTCS